MTRHTHLEEPVQDEYEHPFLQHRNTIDRVTTTLGL